mmetsp:Transcript_72065/g.208726  ORF Transcript_72065/g.208726 Transcript_72065/m.208726 type:complete len:215 (+) Transcript_72065:809-1453(+)
MFCSKSQHLTSQSSEQLNKYGCLSEIARPRTVLTWPVSDNFNVPLAKSQILINLSLPDEANHSFVGSTATVLTQPSWPDKTRINFHGGCQTGFGISWRFVRNATCTVVDGSPEGGLIASIGTTGPGAAPAPSSPMGCGARPDAPEASVSMRVIALGVASRVASSASAGVCKKGFTPSVSSDACSGTFLTCSYSSCIFTRRSNSVAEGSSGRAIA